MPEMPYIPHAGTRHTHIVVIIIGGACISLMYVCVECALVCVFRIDSRIWGLK